MSEQNGSWQPDPTGRHQYRWWNGTEWSDQVSDDGNVSSDPVDVGAAGAPTGASDQPISQEPQPTQATGTGWGETDATTSMPAASSYQSTTTTEPEKKGGSNTPALIVGGVILLALIGAAAFFLLGGDDDERSRDDLIAAVRDDLDLTRSEAECVVDEVGEERLGNILDASADDVSSSDRERLNTAVGECTGSGEETSPTTEGTTTTTEDIQETTTTTSGGSGGTVPDPFLDAFVTAMQSELNLTEAQARCFGEEFLAIDGLDLPGIAADPDSAMGNPALLTAMMEIFEECDIDPASLGGGSGSGSTGSGLTGLLPGQAYGDNPTLDALWDECEAGDRTACRDLYMHSEFGSEYEAFGQENM